jgi:lipopolysaccharide transport system permease protein
MGPLYGSLLGQGGGDYIQYLAISYILWIFISTTVNEACTAFISSEGMIKQISLPKSIHILRMITRNVLLLWHNSVVIIVVLVIYPPASFANLWLLPVGLCLLLTNLLWISLILSMVSTRFRDVPQIVSNVVLVSFFLTPILWRPEMLGSERLFLVEYNPFFYLIDVVRAPLLSLPLNPSNWLVASLMALIGFVISFLIFSRFRSRVAYWL